MVIRNHCTKIAGNDKKSLKIPKS